MNVRYETDWVVAPGETLVEWLEQNSLPPRTQVRTTGMSLDELDAFKAGDLELTPARAKGLELLTFIPARFWLALEHNYRAGLAAGKTRL